LSLARPPQPPSMPGIWGYKRLQTWPEMSCHRWTNSRDFCIKILFN
jgi:hypothetical protein